MTIRRKLVFLMVFGVACSFGFIFGWTESDPIQITVRSFIRAGDALQITVQIEDASAGDTATITIANGLNFIDETLVLGTGGIAVWDIEAEVITQAGTSYIITTYGDWVDRIPLKVLPLKSGHIDLFSSANNIVSYGEDSTTIMMLPEDKWGNIPSSADQFDVRVIYPDTNRIMGKFDLIGGIGLYKLIHHQLNK